MWRAEGLCVYRTQVTLNENAAQGPLQATKPGDATAVKLHGLID